MPLYEYRCPSCGATRDAYRTIPNRDDLPACGACPAAETAPFKMERSISTLQRPLVRPFGYSLHPGDRDFWSFETPQGRKSRPQSAPFAKQEDFEKNPPKAVPADTPVFSEDFR